VSLRPIGVHDSITQKVGSLTRRKVNSPRQGPLGRVGGGLFLSHPHERRASYMNAKFVAGLAAAAIPIMSLLGAASASADINININIKGEYHNTVDKYNDPPTSVTTVHADPDPPSRVRPADMAVRKEFPLFAAPFDPRELAAIGQSWNHSFCHDADKRISERCLDHHH
jgi:hypothetical protein